MNYWVMVVLPAMALSAFAQWRVRSAMSKWSRVGNERGIDGLATAKLIMEHVGLEEVSVDHIAGQMTDHYDPRSRTIRLSQSSTQPSVAAMAIVAHELGHAEQDKTGNIMLNLRASLVPVANIGSQLSWILIIAGIYLNMVGLAWLGIGLFAAAVAFTLVTLPVEFDASRRAKRYLRELNLVSRKEEGGVNAVLNAAAFTYVAAAAGSVLQLVYWISVVNGGRRR